MENLIIGCCLAPRQTPTINKCISSLREAGFHNKIFIFAEPGEYNIEDENVEIQINEERLGCFKNYNHMLNELLKKEGNYIWTIQDDFVFKPECYGIMEDILRSPMIFGYYNFHSRPRLERYIVKNGRNNISLGRKARGMCYLYKRDVVEQMLEHPFYKNHLYTYTLNQQIDACVSETLRQMNLPQYYHNPSLSAHIGQESTIGHTDNVTGEDLDMRFDDIIVGVASIPSRKDALNIMINSLYQQVDKINVYLNNYTEIPEFLNRKKIHVFQGEDIGDRGKFWNIANEHGYYFATDDDLGYAANYCDEMIKWIEKYGRQAIVGVHGVVPFKTPINSYYKDRRVFHFNSNLPQPVCVNILGTGTVAFHTDTIKLDISDFKTSNMADIYLALKAQEQKIPMVCISKTGPYMKQLTVNNSIYNKKVKNDLEETKLINSIQWQTGRITPYGDEEI